MPVKLVFFILFALILSELSITREWKMGSEALEKKQAVLSEKAVERSVENFENKGISSTLVFRSKKTISDFRFRRKQKSSNSRKLKGNNIKNEKRTKKKIYQIINRGNTKLLHENSSTFEEKGLVTHSKFISLGVPETTNFVNDVGRFIADLSLHLHSNVVEVCIRAEGNNKRLYTRLLRHLGSELLYVRNCKDEEEENSVKFEKCSSGNSLGAKWCSPLKIRIWLTSTENVSKIEEKIKSHLMNTFAEIHHVIIADVMKEHIEQTKPPGTARWFYCAYNKSSQYVSISEVYNFIGSQLALQTLMGNWSPSSRMRYVKPLAVGPNDFKGRTLIVSSFIYPPYHMDRSSCQSLMPDRQTKCYANLNIPRRRQLNTRKYFGFSIDIVDIMAEQLNFTYKIAELPIDQHIFGTGSDDNYTGAVGMLARKEADLCSLSLIISRSRMEVIDFTVSIELLPKSMFYKSSAVQASLGWGTFVMGFHWSVWAATVAFWLVYAVLHWVVKKSELNIKSAQLRRRFVLSQEPDIVCAKLIKFADPDYQLQTLQDITFTYFGCGMQQGAPITPSSARLRMIFCLFWFSCVILYASYTATLTSFLTVNNRVPLFRTLQEAANSEYDVAILKGTTLFHAIKNYDTDWARKIAYKLESDPSLQFATENEAKEKIPEMDLVYVSDYVTMRYLIQGNCSFTEMPITLFSGFGRFALSKPSPFLRKIDYTLTNLFSGGILNRLKDRYIKDISTCAESYETYELGFSQTITAFILLAAGLVLSFALMMGEHFLNGRLRKNHQRYLKSSIKENFIFSNDLKKCI